MLILFFVTALFYASVGFGGGSTYLALLLIWGVPYNILPLLALSCNIIVVIGNCFNYIKAGNFNLSLLTPYLVGSVPFSFIGGTISLQKNLFEFILFIVLLISGSLLMINYKSYNHKKIKNIKKNNSIISIIIGSFIGFTSGVVGIGGGIFLSPILFLIRAGKTKHIITTASLFILINSIFGVLGQLTKKSALIEIQNYWILLFIVLIGGQIGNYLNLKVFPTRALVLITSFLVLFVALRLGVKIFV